MCFRTFDIYPISTKFGVKNTLPMQKNKLCSLILALNYVKMLPDSTELEYQAHFRRKVNA